MKIKITMALAMKTYCNSHYSQMLTQSYSKDFDCCHYDELFSLKVQFLYLLDNQVMKKYTQNEGLLDYYYQFKAHRCHCINT